ncbi:MAG: PA14 domain-containing protein [Planctomycetota bacterium]|jgi:uncharacterized membrane protein|nr:PA14 domain-containing protein [Planctomycetota bacterium]
MSADTGWSFALTGMSPLLVIPLAVVAWVVIRRVYADEAATVGGWARRGLPAIRGSVMVIVILLLLEPSCTRQERSALAPTVTVLVDSSASMAVADPGMDLSRRLDEAVALGFVAADRRPVVYREAARVLRASLDELPRLQAALTLTGNADDLSARRSAAAELAAVTANTLDTAIGPIGDEPLVLAFGTIRDLFMRVAHELEAGGGAAGLETDLAQATESGRALVRNLKLRQQQDDVTALAADEALTAGLARWDALSRFERAALFVHERLEPQLRGKAELRVRRMDEQGTAIDAGGVDSSYLATLAMRTDVTGALRQLTEVQVDNHTSVVVISDGRATTGGDPSPVARALRARGIAVHSLVIGDPSQPRDAAVAEIIGSGEVYLRELVRLDVRYRVTGFDDRPWDLVLTRNGVEVERRQVVGTGRWEIERFEFRAEEAGVMQLSARIEPLIDGPGVSGKRGLLWEQWDDIGGNEVAALTSAKVFAGQAKNQRIVGSAASPSNVGDRFGARMRGWLVPPQSGDYEFAIVADDSAQLWIGTDDAPESKGLIARCDSYVPPDAWDQRRQQVSRPVPLLQGQRYYFEVLHKEGTGGDHVAVAWKLPDGSRQRPIPGSFLRPWGAEAAHAELSLDPDAEVSLDNNQADTAIVVHEDPLRVLVIDHLARWESRYLVSLFERDRRVEVTRRYRQVLLAAGDRSLLPQHQEGLDAFDVVVLGDVRPDELAPEDQRHLGEFVTRRGGFLVVVAGRRGMPGLYSLGGLNDVLPVRGSHEDDDPAMRKRVVLSESGMRHPITSVLDDRKLNVELWPRLAPLTWVARGTSAKPAASVLLRTDDQEAVPVLAIMRSGAGRVVYCGTDETWRWRDRVGDRVHQTLWLQALRWGLGARLRGSDPQLQMALDRSLAGPGDPVEVRVRATDADGIPLEGSPVVEVRSLDGDGHDLRRLELAPVADGSGLWQTTIDDLTLGQWELIASHPRLDVALTEHRDLFIRTKRSAETVELRADPAFLRSMSDAGGGLAADMANADLLLEQIVASAEPRERLELRSRRLWDGYAILLLVVGLLTGEWLWRKRKGLP